MNNIDIKIADSAKSKKCRITFLNKRFFNRKKQVVLEKNVELFNTKEKNIY